MSAVDGRFRPDEPVSPVEAAQFCVTRLGRTPPLGDWSHITHGEFFTLITALLEK